MNKLVFKDMSVSFFFLFFLYRDEKSLRHDAMVAKFLDDNEPKIRTFSNFIDRIQFHLTCQMLAIFSGLNPKGLYLS